jgi:biopolymer transport protein ExbD
MRYPRNVKIFRGGIDAAPFAGLFFVLVLLMMLFHSHIFFPGVPVELGEQIEEPEITPRLVKVLRSGEVQFLGADLRTEAIEKELQNRIQKGTLPKRLVLDAEIGADARIVEKVERMLSASGIAIKLPGARLELPEDAGFVGAANPVVVVAVNLNGQVFFQHQLLPPDDRLLHERLSVAVERAAGPVTMLLQADKMVPLERITRLMSIARRAGVTRVHIATRPRLG